MDSDRLRVVAEIGEAKILYGEIACNRTVVERHERWRGGRSVDDVCAEVEQDAFNIAVMRHLHDQACAQERCSLTDADIAPFRKSIDDAAIEKAAAEQREKAEAMLRTLNDDDELRSSIEKLLAKDIEAMIRDAIETSARRNAMRAFLRSRIAGIAEAKGQSLEEAADAYLAALIERVGVRLIDKRYDLPTASQVFLR